MTPEAVIQVIGSLMILAPFILVQMRRLTSTSRTYLTLNAVGSSVLAIDAALGHQWGFLLLEGVWAVVSAGGLLRTIVKPPQSGERIE